MKRILITGVSGLLGINLALGAAKKHQIFGIVNRHQINSNEFTIIKADLLEPDAIATVLEQAQPDCMIHCAALANLDDCEKNPELAWKLNAELPGQIALETARYKIRLIHISTDSVFDGKRGNYSEFDVPNPINEYARSKLAGENEVLKNDPESIVARTNIFGWSGIGNKGLVEFFINNLQSSLPIKGFTDVFFSPLLVNDLATTLLKMMDLNLKGLYHVVSANAMSKYEFGVALAYKFGFDEKLIEPTSVKDGNLEAARSPNLTLLSDKIARSLGEKMPSISDGLARLYQLYQDKYPQKLKQMVEPMNISSF